MRIAIVSDIHGNRTALDAVLTDLRQTAPDLILHGGDLADGGCSPVEILDTIRELGWPGVVGNTDEMLFRPASLIEYANQFPHLKSILDVTAEMASFTREMLGAERLAWLAGLPRVHRQDRLTLVHASPASPWRSPLHTADDAELQSTYSPLGGSVVVYGHIHQPYVRNLTEMTVANSGSVGLPFDGDPRASYLLLDDGEPWVRRVAYDIDRELKALAGSGLPHADWVCRTLANASPQMP